VAGKVQPRPVGLVGDPVTDPSMAPRLRRKTVYVEVQLQDEAELFLHRARNLSTGGMFVDAPVPLPVGSAVELQFSLPTGTRFHWRAEVRWNTDMASDKAKVRHPGMGVIFTEMVEGDPDELRLFIMEDEG